MQAASVVLKNSRLMCMVSNTLQRFVLLLENVTTIAQLLRGYPLSALLGSRQGRRNTAG